MIWHSHYPDTGVVPGKLGVASGVPLIAGAVLNIMVFGFDIGMSAFCSRLSKSNSNVLRTPYASRGEEAKPVALNIR